MRRSPDNASDAEVSVRCNGGSLHSIGAGTDKEDGADDQPHQQQTDAWPTAGECGIKASQHVPRHDYCVMAARANPPRGGGCDSLGSWRPVRGEEL